MNAPRNEYMTEAGKIEIGCGKWWWCAVGRAIGGTGRTDYWSVWYEKTVKEFWLYWRVRIGTLSEDGVGCVEPWRVQWSCRKGGGSWVHIAQKRASLWWWSTTDLQKVRADLSQIFIRFFGHYKCIIYQHSFPCSQCTSSVGLQTFIGTGIKRCLIVCKAFASSSSVNH